MRVVIVEPCKPPYERDIEDKLEEFQKIVDGLIEVTYDRMLPGCVIVCNEEGKISNLPMNRFVGPDIIFGTFFVCGEDGEEFCSLTDAQVKEAREIYE